MGNNTEIIGIHEGHNSSIAKIVNGRLCFAVQEERLTRVKNQGGLPEKSLSLLGDCREVAWAGAHLFNSSWNREDVLAAYDNSRFRLKDSIWSRIRNTDLVGNYINDRREQSMVSKIGGLFDGEAPSFCRLDHHLCHASSAYYGWGRMEEPVLVLTCDGAGDYLCATVNIGRSGRLEQIATVRQEHSVGRLYSMVTRMMGMVPLEHEYKVMGLAPYGANTNQAKTVESIFRQWFKHDSRAGMTWAKNNIPDIQYMADHLHRVLRNFRFDHIAAGLQAFLEVFLSQWVRNCIRETKIRSVALSGGVFMNVKLNQKILELEDLKELFVFPSCGDETNAIGSAWHRHVEITGTPPESLRDFYLGDEFDEETIGRSVDEFDFQEKIQIRECRDIEAEVASILADGGVVARFSGRMEFGARALGNRSILANAAVPNVISFINDAIKQRDFWMPFAGSVLAERAEDYYENPKSADAPYMIITFNTRPEARRHIGGAMHPRDYTTRPQVVKEEINPGYYRLLKNFEELTGEAFILNTSFNLHGEPLVRTPEDAMDVFERSGLPALALGNFLLTKQDFVEAPGWGRTP